MKVMCHGLWVSFVCLMGMDLCITAEAVDMHIQEKWSSVFGGEEVEYHIDLISEEAYEGRVTWQLAAEQGTLSSEERMIRLQAGHRDTLAINLRIPPVRPGVNIPLTWVVALGDGSTSLVRRLQVFSEHVFENRESWLDTLNLYLYDPEELTSARFEAERVPFNAVRNPDAFPDLSDGLLVIGEGVSFSRYPSLMEQMLKAASKGLPVLCLAPSGGWTQLPGVGEEAFYPHPDSVYWKGAAVILEINKALDANAWPPDGRIYDVSPTVQSDRNQVMAEIRQDRRGWPWIEAVYNEKGGRFVLCSFPIISKWEDGPTPRYLFSSLLEYMTTNKEESK